MFVSCVYFGHDWRSFRGIFCDRSSTLLKEVKAGNLDLKPSPRKLVTSPQQNQNPPGYLTRGGKYYSSAILFAKSFTKVPWRVLFCWGDVTNLLNDGWPVSQQRGIRLAQRQKCRNTWEKNCPFEQVFENRLTRDGNTFRFIRHLFVDMQTDF